MPPMLHRWRMPASPPLLASLPLLLHRYDCGVEWPWPATKVKAPSARRNNTARLSAPVPLQLSLSG